MKGASLRLVRIVLIAVAAWALYLLLEPYGLGWLVIPIAILGTLGVGVFRYVRARAARTKAAREDGWSAAVLDGRTRPDAIREVEAAIAAAKDEPTRVRFTVLLAELLDAEGESDEAEKRLEGLAPDELAPIQHAVVRHARASLALRQGDAEKARSILEPRAPRCGNAELDLRLSLLDAAVDAELGEIERALETANRVRRKAVEDEALATEARVVRAAALDAMGDRKEALDVLRALDAELLGALVELGWPRVRDLADEALDR